MDVLVADLERDLVPISCILEIRDEQRPFYFKREYFSSGFFFCCGDAFALLPEGELFFLGCAFLFIAFRPPPDCEEFWEGRPRACLARFFVAVLTSSPANTSCATWTPVCRAFLPRPLAPW